MKSGMDVPSPDPANPASARGSEVTPLEEKLKKWIPFPPSSVAADDRPSAQLLYQTPLFWAALLSLYSTWSSKASGTSATTAAASAKLPRFWSARAFPTRAAWPYSTAPAASANATARSKRTIDSFSISVVVSPGP
ncbi:MAG: hypothetical protein GWM90_14385 [Gemmatimonadetes bacterium]|nr:hypothetical protein [Gemmatimonadota bacterium]NIQ55334.1 hypothetical protein [Gemmatimonadota bacterium]NIU75537.1 hypothetical protein [Gammaproteobacteria bacterium]NIX45256.1 hypothetical protein [Gemmatimonadota bacterium]NIY09520.1 hypothetical protein [Gemmatimonadota bacterium]